MGVMGKRGNERKEEEEIKGDKERKSGLDLSRSWVWQRKRKKKMEGKILEEKWVGEEKNKKLGKK